MTQPDAKQLIERLDLAPHPEGGWYKETWRAPHADGQRPASTAIHFLLERGQRSHWHRVDADEIWLWHAGDPLRLHLAARDAGPTRTVIMGPRIGYGHSMQEVVPAGYWQAADPDPTGPAGYALVSCVVAPGFDFGGFELAPEGWTPGG